MEKKIKFEFIKNLPTEIKVILYCHKGKTNEKLTIEEYCNDEDWEMVTLIYPDNRFTVYLNDEKMIYYINHPQEAEELKNTAYRLAQFSTAMINVDTYEVIKNRYGYNTKDLNYKTTMLNCISAYLSQNKG